MFKSALIKLTLWYTLIAIILSLLFSIFVYHFAAIELKEGLSHQLNTLTTHDPDTDALISKSEFNNRAADLYIQLVDFNIAVFVLAVAGSFLLARRTLRPIQAAHEAQVRFSAYASHELKTPLSAIRADTESVLLLPKADNRVLRKTLAANLDDVKRLEELAGHLLELAKWRSVKPANEQIDLVPLCRQAVADINRSYKPRQVRVALIAADQIPIKIQPEAIRQVLMILLDNAVKYGQSSDITLSASADHRQVVIKVNSKGLINVEDIKHIFEPFYRSQGSLKDNGSFGLGLTLAREIVEANGGSISATSSQQSGTEFTVLLPQKR